MYRLVRGAVLKTNGIGHSCYIWHGIGYNDIGVMI